MFDFTFSKIRVPGLYSLIRRRYRKQGDIVPLFWTEHCMECSAPACYKTCDRYKRRADGDCIRIVNGITPIATKEGIGARCEFRTWAKIESQLKTKTLSGNSYAFLYRIFSLLGYFFRGCASISPFSKLQYFFDKGWFSVRQKIINHIINSKESTYALTLQGTINNNDHASTFLVDVKSVSKHLFRDIIEVPLGESRFRVNIPPYEDGKKLYFINVHPTNAEEHITIDFESLELKPTDITKGKKIKLVVWDLDNTLWKGTLIENKNVEINQRFIQLIKEFDSCGIVNSIVSKNDEEEAGKKLKELGIVDYFVFKKINWEPKSVNICNTIMQMNINANSVVFVDDNPFERNEVLLRQPSISCIDPSEVEEFVKCERFKMIVTDDSKKRRATYKMMESMQQEEKQWNGDINDFLRSCDIRLNLSRPTERTTPRCYELLQRTNQLNSSGRRLSLDEVKKIIASDSYDCYVLNSSDKFGDYGIVGFLIVENKGQKNVVTDFVISCRVANKKIEPSVINYLAKKYGGEIAFNYKKTLRNGPMFNIIKELGMQKESVSQDTETYKCKYDPKFPNIVTINDLTGNK